MKKEIIYFEEKRSANTKEVLEAAKKRAVELGISHVVIASSHGSTAIAAAEIFIGTGIKLIAVGISCTYAADGWSLSEFEKNAVRQKGVEVLVSHHGLEEGIGEAFMKEGSVGYIVANTLRCFCQGMKVAVECSIMAAEAGLIPAGKEIVSIAGTGEGADTALVLMPAYARKFKELNILEIIAKPRYR